MRYRKRTSCTCLNSSTILIQQDSYLQGLREIKPIERQRPTPGISENMMKSKKHSVFYHLSYNGENIKVCMNTILTLYSVTTKRLRKISGLVACGKSPNDMWGKNPKGNVVSSEICQKMKEHIECFPTKVSHYTGKPIPTYMAT